MADHQLEIPARETTLFFHDVLDSVTPVAPEDLPIVDPGRYRSPPVHGGHHRSVKRRGAASPQSDGQHSATRQLVFSRRDEWRVFLAALPLFHVFGMTVTQNICLAVGGCMVLVPDPRNMPILLTLLRKKQPTVITIVPALVRKLLEHCDAKDFHGDEILSFAAGPRFPTTSSRSSRSGPGI